MAAAVDTWSSLHKQDAATQNDMRGSPKLLPRRARPDRSPALGRGSLLRSAALLAAGALLLHYGSYLLRSGKHELVPHGHGYLSLLAPIVGLLVALAAGHFALALLRARGTRPPEAPPPSFRWAWLGATTALLAVHAAQEGLEAHLAAGHESAPEPLLAPSAWVVLALAVLIGAAVALLVCGAQLVLAAIGRRNVPRRRPLTSRPRLPWRDFSPTDPIAVHIGGRGPPFAAR